MDTKKLYFIFSILLLSKFSSGERFIVNIIEYEFGNITDGIVKCAGTVISDRHVLTTSFCAEGRFGREIGVEIDTINEFGNSSFRIPAKARIHPDRNDLGTYNNIAVLEVDTRFNSPEFGPLALGGLKLNQSCYIYGWGGGSAQPRREQLLIGSCPGNETQAYCTRIFFEDLGSICGAMAGSPVLCGEEREVNGIVLFACSLFVPFVYYHSVEDFSSWIRWETSGAEMTTTLSSLLMVAALSFCLKKFF